MPPNIGHMRVSTTQSSFCEALRLRSTGNEPSQFQERTVTKTRIGYGGGKEGDDEIRSQFPQRSEQIVAEYSNCILYAFTIIIKKEVIFFASLKNQ